MSTPGPFGGDPFGGLPIFGDLAKLFSSSGPVNLELARQVAMGLATEGQAEGNVDPIERMRYEELIRVAEMHVAEATGLDTTASGGIISVLPIGRADWAARALEAYRPLLEALATSLASAQHLDADADADEQRDPATDLLGSIGKMLGPVMMGFQAGSMVGHLATRAFGQYDMPIPRPPSDQLLVVPANLNAFGEAWSLPLDDLRMWLCLHEVTHHAVLNRPHVRQRLDELLRRYASGFRPDPSALEDSLGGFDMSDPSSLQQLFGGDPEAMLGAMQTDEQRVVLRDIEALTAAIEGYADLILDTVGRRLVGSFTTVAEAVRRRRVERNQGDRFVERLLGVELGQAQYDRGAAFAAGVVERASVESLARLWHSARELPTPAEVDAPGLWLARIDLPEG